MRKSLGADAKRVFPVFLGVALAHFVAGLWAERERGAPAPPFTADAAPIPVVLAPPPPKSRLSVRPRVVRQRIAEARVRRADTALAPLALEGDAVGLAPPIPFLPAGPAAPGAHAEATAPPTLAPPFVAIQYPVNPGYWQVAEHWFILSKTEFYCVDPFSILRFMVEPCNHIYRCSYGLEDVGDGKIRFAGVIRGHDERYDVSGAGAYSQTQIDVSVKASGHYKILPVAFGASLQARYISDACPAGAKRIRQR